MPEMVFDYAFLGSEGERLAIPVLVARDRRTHMIFAHIVPSNGLAHEHGKGVSSRTSVSRRTIWSA